MCKVYIYFIWAVGNVKMASKVSNMNECAINHLNSFVLVVDKIRRLEE